MDRKYELIVIGGGPAGLAAAYSAWEQGLCDVLIVERNMELGGILNQCIHTGFGIDYFGEELAGPEYAERFVSRLRGTSIEVMLSTMAVKVTDSKEVHISGRSLGYMVLSAQSVVFATGCRERTRGAIGIPGSRSSGVITAGAAQYFVNVEGYIPAKRAIILGSGDIGLIMARRLALEGVEVLACVEIMPKAGGLTRNVVQCLHDFDIPLLLSHTITDICGDARVESVVVSKVDENQEPIAGTQVVYECDTVIISVGLISENELVYDAGILIDRQSVETSVPGIFICGNALNVQDIVDSVTIEGIFVGDLAAKFVIGQGGRGCG